METSFKNKEKLEIVPIIPTMDVVVFPQMIVPLLVVDERIIKGINKSIEESKLVLLLASQKQTSELHDAIGTKDLYSIGTLASIMRIVKIPDGGIKILVQGICKAKAEEIIANDDMLSAKVSKVDMEKGNEEEIIAHIKNIKNLAEKMATSGQSFSSDFHIILAKMQDPEKIADFIVSHLNLNVEQSQELLEKKTQVELIEKIYLLLQKELEISQVQERVKNNARESINKSQKEYYLREQLKAIKKELGEDDTDDIDSLRQKLSELSVSEEVRTEINKQISRLEKTAPDSMEATVIRNYLEFVLGLPWGKETEDNLDLEKAKEILDEDHHGMKEIKDRILDFISIRILKQDGYTPILCFIGPPGTGKTSLGKSIAKSLGREYFRISLGGVKDEAEIRGHRRTYVGAMPGRFMQGIRKAGTCNPVVIIDELDKIGADFRGDPSAAMLEVLDPQQNKTFYDNYLGIPFDLSKVIFIATANNLDSISEPLRDRMEIIQLSGYTLEEKVLIAKKHINRKAIVDAGLADKNIEIDENIIKHIISSYTRESGVRELDRVIRKLCSKAARVFVEANNIPKFTIETLDKHLGPGRFIQDVISKENQIGICNGLAWTPYGGEIIKIEAILMPGKGKLILTGQLGDVMKESAKAALSYARAHAKEFGIPHKIFTDHDLHIHLPSGGVPKDGPSAGITLLSSILSVLTDRPINADYAMTGELNLQGEVMPIGGLKEKILAAKRNGIGHIILPKKNRNDLIDIDEVVKDIEVIWVEKANEVLSKVLMQNGSDLTQQLIQNNMPRH